MEPFTIQGLVKEYTGREGTRTLAVDGVSIRTRPGEITCIVGPTACGKTTILRCLAGLDLPDGGEVMVGGIAPAAMTGRMGYVTQRHTLLPWLTTRRNVELPLRLAGKGGRERDDRIGKIFDSLGLRGFESLYPYELSGGMQQRAALGRLLSSEAPYWLLDEPFSNLDELTRHRLQDMLLAIRDQNDLSVLFVTHSIDEAIYLADEIYVLSTAPGKVLDSLRPDLPSPRDRLSPEFGALMEGIRKSIQSVLG